MIEVKEENKSVGIEAINGLNSLLLELYDDKSLYPVSLKKQVLTNTKVEMKKIVNLDHIP